MSPLEVSLLWSIAGVATVIIIVAGAVLIREIRDGMLRDMWHDIKWGVRHWNTDKGN